MATIAGIESAGGVVLAGDRQVIDDGTLTGTRRHVFDLDGIAAAAVGGDVDVFRRRLDAEVRAYRRERDEPGVETLARLAVDVADGTDVEAIVAGRADDGRASIRAIADGAVLADPVAAFGDGAATVVGALEGAVPESPETAETLLREAFSSASERDPGTGEEIDVVTVTDAE